MINFSLLIGCTSNSLRILISSFFVWFLTKEGIQCHSIKKTSYKFNPTLNVSQEEFMIRTSTLTASKINSKNLKNKFKSNFLKNIQSLNWPWSYFIDS